MPIIFSKHAKEMLKQRQIKQILAKNCAYSPDYILPGQENKKIYLKDFGNNFLKLIVAEEGDDKIIITLYWLAKKRVKL